MIALLPVSRYRVRYQVASGRPYSFFERFILEAIRDGSSSLDDLEQTFRVHRRALIEGLVTLIQAGWVALDRESHKLVATKAGSRAIRRPNELPKNISVVEQEDYVVGERVQGQVAKGTEITFSPRAVLRGYLQDAVLIRSRDLPHPLDPGLLVPLLRKDELEWIRSSGPVDIVRDGADFAVVDVNTASGVITGIPSKWVPLLRDELLERTRTKERQMLQDGLLYSPDPALVRLVRAEPGTVESAGAFDPDEWLVESSPGRFVYGSEHVQLFKSWLETARTYLAIVTESLDAATVARFEQALRAAVDRGVVIDVLWGRKADDANESHNRAIEVLKNIEFDSYNSVGRGRLSLARMATHSNARVLLGDVSEAFEAVVGAYNWLGAEESRARSDVSLVLSEFGPVGRVTRIVADLADADERLSSGIGLIRLRRAAEDLSRLTAEAAERRHAELEKGVLAETTSQVPTHTTSSPEMWRARIIVGRQHHAILSSMASEARRRLVVSAHTWGRSSQGAFRPLTKALEEGCAVVELHYGSDCEPGASHDELRTALEKVGGTLRHSPEIGARIAVADEDTAVITSFDWLSPNIEGRLAIASDVGFALRGNKVGSLILDRVGIRSAETRAPLEATYITGFRISNLRSIRHIEWQITADAAPGWHVLVGDNGAGKTSILRSLAVALIGTDNAQALRQDWSTWVRGSESYAEVELTLQRVPGSQGVRLPEAEVAKVIFERIADTTTVRAEPSVRPEAVSVGYGPFRRLTGGDPDYQKQLSSIPGLAQHISLFDERAALTEGLAWLRELQFKALEADPESTLLLDRLTKLVNESGLLPAGVRLEQISSDAVIFRDEYGFEYGIEELSDGYRAVLSLTFDIVRQLSISLGAGQIFDQERQNIVTAPPIVFIDEADAHLHPSWQRTLGQWFRRHFPRVQFLVTTHSPLICQAAEIGSVYRLPDTSDDLDSGGMLDGQALSRLIYGNVLEAYASGAFGEGVTRSDSSLALMERLAELNRKEITSGLSAEERKEQEKLRSTLPLTANIVTDESSN